MPTNISLVGSIKAVLSVDETRLYIAQTLHSFLPSVPGEHRPELAQGDMRIEVGHCIPHHASSLNRIP
jgi:hypothetical protein